MLFHQGQEATSRFPGNRSCASSWSGRRGEGKAQPETPSLGGDWFESRLEFKPVTQSCWFGIRGWNRKRIVVIDTPPLFDSDESLTSPELQHCFRLCSPGPHALVLVSQLGRFTEADLKAAKRAKKVFGKGAKKYLFLLFTRREDLRSETLEQYLSHSDKGYFRDLKHEEYCGFNNNETGEKQEAQVNELLSKIEQMVVKNKDKPYCAVTLDATRPEAVYGEEKEKEEEEKEKPQTFRDNQPEAVGESTTCV